MPTEKGPTWDDFLNPEVMRPKLISAAIYIAVFEILKDTIITRIRDFYCSGFDEHGDVIDPRYQQDVLGRNRSPVHASLDWLKEMGALEDNDFAVFATVKEFRNKLAHRVVANLSSLGATPEFQLHFNQMILLLRKIEVWWIVNVEIPVNSDIDCDEIDEDEIVPGTIASIQILMKVALGDVTESREFYEDFQKMVGRSGH